MLYLATSGDEAKVWDVPTFSLLEQFNPYHDSISDLAWSDDGHFIASCCSSDQTVYLRLTKTKQTVPSGSFLLPAGCQCLEYSSSSRYLLCGCVDGSVHIWDNKSKAFKKSFRNLGHPVTVVRWNWNDTYVSMGLKNGSILLYNVTTSQSSSPLVTTSSNTIRQLKYNPYQKSSLVSVSEDGVVNFWDTNTRRLVHGFTKTHQAPATDLTFSPINDCLMVSVGLDKRAVFYDVKNKSSVKTVVAEHPLTSVDFMQDGATVVVGTTRGKIFFYDMRQPSVPMFNFTAHKSSVKHLNFVKQDNEKNDSNSSQGSRRQLPTTPVSSTDSHNQNCNNTNYQSPTSNRNLTGLDIFSPLSNVNKSGTSVTDKTGSEKSWTHNLTGSVVADVFTSSQGVFSPLQHDNSRSINTTYNRSSLLSDESFLTKVLAPIENVNKDVGDNHGNSLYTIGEVPSDNINSSTIDRTNSLQARESNSENSRSLPQRSIGASPSIPQLSSQRIDDADSTSFINKISPTAHRTSLPLPASSSPSTSSQPHRIAFRDTPEVITSVNGGATSYSQQATHLRYKNNEISDPLTMRIEATSSSPSRSPSNSQNTRQPSETVSSSAPCATSSMRHVVQDLLREQFHEYQDQLKSDIRAMLASPGLNTLAVSHPANSASLPSLGNPGIFQAEFIRNLIREELDDLKDFIHKEFWCVQVELIKQIFQLQMRMEAGFAEFANNSVLFDEIDRLREENARLKKTF